MSSHAQHEASLRELLAADPEGVRGFESSALSACADCRRSVEQHLGLLRELGELAREEGAALEQAARLELAPGRAEAALEAHILAGLAPAARAHGPARRRLSRLRLSRLRLSRLRLSRLRLSRVGLAGLLAAAALLLVAALFWRPASAPHEAQTLGPDSGWLHPVGRVDGYTPFRWSVPLPEGGHFVLHLEGPDFEYESEWLYTQEFTPEETLDWPSELRLDLRVYRASGSGVVTQRYLEWARR